MHILLNSDVLWTNYLWVKLPDQVNRLAKACREQGHVILVPETAYLEFKRRQEELVPKERAELVRAFSTLKKFGISYSYKIPDEVVSFPDLIGLIAETGATARVIGPTLEEFQEAHKRACLHLPPQPPDTKSDEMRDLVIWMVALRVALDNDGALLVSRDEVHVHERGDSEASLKKLVRVASFEEALEYLEVETPAGQLFRKLMLPAWPQLLSAGLPVSDSPTVLSASGTEFIQGDEGLASACSAVKVRVADGKVLRANVQVEILAEVEHVTLKDISIDGKTYTGPVSVEAEYHEEVAADFEQDLSELRQVLEE